MKNLFKILLFLFALQLASCANDEDEYVTLTPELGEEYSGGESNTVFNSSEEAFGFASTNLTFEEQSDFGIGNSFFRQSWVSAPASQLLETV